LNLRILGDVGLRLQNLRDRRWIVGRLLDAEAGTNFFLRLINLLLRRVQIGQVALRGSADIQYRQLVLNYPLLADYPLPSG
jgi:hypothetical protein